MNILTEDEAYALGSTYNLAKADVHEITNAVLAKLAQGMEFPEPHEYVWNPDGTFNIGQERCLSSNTGPCKGWEIYPIYSLDQLRTAIAAMRVRTLEEAAKVCIDAVEEHKLHSNFICAGAIRKLIGTTLTTGETK